MISDRVDPKAVRYRGSARTSLTRIVRRSRMAAEGKALRNRKRRMCGGTAGVPEDGDELGLRVRQDALHAVLASHVDVGQYVARRPMSPVAQVRRVERLAVALGAARVAIED